MSILVCVKHLELRRRTYHVVAVKGVTRSQGGSGGRAQCIHHTVVVVGVVVVGGGGGCFVGSLSFLFFV